MIEHPPAWWLRLYREITDRAFHGSITVYAAGGQIRQIEKRQVERIHAGTTVDIGLTTKESIAK